MRRALLLVCTLTLASCGSSSVEIEPGDAVVSDTASTTAPTASTPGTTNDESSQPGTDSTPQTRPPTTEGAMPAASDLSASSATRDALATEAENWFGWPEESIKLTGTAPIPFNTPLLAFAPATLGGVEHTYTAQDLDANGNPTTVSVKLRVLLVESPATADEFLDAFSELRAEAVTVRDTSNLPLADHSVGTCLPSDPAKPRGPKSSEMIASAGRLIVWSVVSYTWDVCTENVARIITDTEMRAQLRAHPALTAP